MRHNPSLRAIAARTRAWYRAERPKRRRLVSRCYRTRGTR